MFRNKTFSYQEFQRKYSAYLVWGVILIIIIFVSAIRIRLLQVPLERDEGEYAYIAQLMLQGIPPYVEAYSMKMPGIYAVYALIMAVFGQTQAGIHLGLLFVNAATIVLMFLIARKLFDSLTGVIAAACFAILSLSPSVHGIFANSEHFVVLPVIGGLLLLLRAVESEHPRDFFFSGLLLGTAFIVKQYGVFFVFFAVLYIFFKLWTPPTISLLRRLSVCASFLIGAVIPLALTVFALLFVGVFDKFWFWVIVYPFEYISALPLDLTFLARQVSCVVRLSVLIWCCAGLGLTALAWDKKARSQSFFVGLFFTLSFLSVSPGLYFRPHYFILLLPAVALLASIGVTSVGRLFTSHRLLFLRRWAPILLVAIVLIYSVYKQRILLFQLSPAMASRTVYGGNPFPESLKIAEYFKERTTEKDSIAVIGSEPQIYFYSARRSATAYLYMYELMGEHKFALEMQQEMIREIESACPKFIIFVNVMTSWSVNPCSEGLLFNWFVQYHDRYYDKVGIVDIVSLKKSLYYWGEDSIGYVPRSSCWLTVYERRNGHFSNAATAGVEDSAEES